MDQETETAPVVLALPDSGRTFAAISPGAMTWMMGAIASFSLMAIAVRELSHAIPVVEILFFRNAIGIVLIAAVILGGGQSGLFRTARPKVHLARNVFHFAGQCGWVFAIGALSLADVVALEFTVPVWVAIIAALFLRERLTVPGIGAIVLGALGVIVIVKPGVGALQPAAILMLCAAVCYAVAYTTNKVLTATESPLTILFYMCAFQLPMATVLTVSGWVTPMHHQWVWLLVIGGTALTGHYCMTRAMQVAPVGVVMTLDFLRLPVITLIGVWLYAEPFDVAVIMGASLILGGNLLNVHAQLARRRY